MQAELGRPGQRHRPEQPVRSGGCGLSRWSRWRVPRRVFQEPFRTLGAQRGRRTTRGLLTTRRVACFGSKGWSSLRRGLVASINLNVEGPSGGGFRPKGSGVTAHTCPLDIRGRGLGRRPCHVAALLRHHRRPRPPGPMPMWDAGGELRPAAPRSSRRAGQLRVANPVRPLGNRTPRLIVTIEAPPRDGPSGPGGRWVPQVTGASAHHRRAARAEVESGRAGREKSARVGERTRSSNAVFPPSERVSDPPGPVVGRL